MNQLETLKVRGNLLRPRKRGAKKKWISKVSKKRSEALKEYRGARREFLERHPYCHACVPIAHHQTGKDWYVVNPTIDVHHRAGRIGAKLMDKKDWLAVCRGCHEFIHSHPSQARTLGLLK